MIFKVYAYDRSTCDIQIFQSSVKPILKDRFSHAMVDFPFLERLVTSKHDEVHDSANFIWFYIYHTRTLNGISMR